MSSPDLLALPPPLPVLPLALISTAFCCDMLRALCAAPRIPSRLKLVLLRCGLRSGGDLILPFPPMPAPLVMAVRVAEGTSTVKASRPDKGNWRGAEGFVAEGGESPVGEGDMPRVLRRRSCVEDVVGKLSVLEGLGPIRGSRHFSGEEMYFNE